MRSFFLFSVFVMGCGGGDFAVSNAVPEDASFDTGGATDDTGVLVDSATTDSAASDSGASEVGSGEGGVTEGGVVDAGPMCPKPPSTKTYDYSGLTCTALQTAYGEALTKAKVCECDTACSATLPNDFCNNCQSFVAPSNDAYRSAKALFDEWNKRTAAGTCPGLACPDVLCPPPVLGGCHGSGAGTTRTCRTTM